MRRLKSGDTDQNATVVPHSTAPNTTVENIAAVAANPIVAKPFPLTGAHCARAVAALAIALMPPTNLRLPFRTMPTTRINQRGYGRILIKFP